MFFYEPDAEYECAIKYEINVYDNYLDIFPIEKYQKEDVVFSGAKK